MATGYCDSCNHWGGHSEHCERHPINRQKKQLEQTASFLKILRNAELCTFPKTAKNDLIALGVSEERADDFMFALYAQKGHSLLSLLMDYGEVFIPEISLLVNHYNKTPGE